jgi:hypothetical protein
MYGIGEIMIVSDAYIQPQKATGFLTGGEKWGSFRW